MRIAVVGDSFMPVEIFLAELNRLGPNHEISALQIDEGRTADGVVGLDRLREYAGTPDQVAGILDGHEALVVHAAPVTQAVLTASASLRLVCCARGGPVNVDLDAATRLGIPVATAPGKNAEAVAELTIMLMVMLARRTAGAMAHVAGGAPLGHSALEGAGFLGQELGGRTLGLVGYGNVGARVAWRARAFGMEVVVHDPYVLEKVVLGDGHRVSELSSLVGEADFISLHARSTPETEDMFGPELFAAVRPGAFFVNTARETLVDEDALLRALDSGRLAGAALDVVRPRPVGSPNPLVGRDDLLVLPHIGGATRETLTRGAAMAAAEIGRLIDGEALSLVANPTVLAPG